MTTLFCRSAHTMSRAVSCKWAKEECQESSNNRWKRVSFFLCKLSGNKSEVQSRWNPRRKTTLERIVCWGRAFLLCDNWQWADIIYPLYCESPDRSCCNDETPFCRRQKHDDDENFSAKNFLGESWGVFALENAVPSPRVRKETNFVCKVGNIEITFIQVPKLPAADDRSEEIWKLN